MKALAWHGKGDIRCDDVADPRIEHPRDAIIKVTACAICGSDLHIYGGIIPSMQSGDILGHESRSNTRTAAAELGRVHSYNQTPKQMLEEFEKLDPEGNIDRTFARLAAAAPAVKQAEAKLAAVNRDLAVAELDLRYCDVVAEIDGVVTRRNVNPGNDIQVGQSLMAIRSLNEIWVDANFKETQLRRLCVHVDLFCIRIFPYG